MDPSRSPEGANYEGFAHNGIYWVRERATRWLMKENFEVGMFDRQRRSVVEAEDCQVLERAWQEGLDRWTVEAKIVACPRCGGGLEVKYVAASHQRVCTSCLPTHGRVTSTGEIYYLP